MNNGKYKIIKFANGYNNGKIFYYFCNERCHLGLPEQAGTDTLPEMLQLLVQNPVYKWSFTQPLRTIATKYPKWKILEEIPLESIESHYIRREYAHLMIV